MSRFWKNILWAIVTLLFISFLFSLFAEPGEGADDAEFESAR